MKGGGGPPSASGIDRTTVSLRRFVGAHVALCGHAVHSECWESYLATVSQREDRTIGKRDEFRCPLCQRLSNCLVPFIDVGVDWIDCATCLAPSIESSESRAKGVGSSVDMLIESVSASVSPSLNQFLASTPWWVTRHNNSVVWDGQCAFISALNGDDEDDQDEKASTKVARRRSSRPLRKKDLYAAWNAMMKTPRFVRRKLRSRTSLGSSQLSEENAEIVATQLASTESTGETVVWRRFMDQISDITYRADGKRLGDEDLHSDFGEFRHYVVEKYAYNMTNRYAGKEPSDWPSCVFPTTPSDTQRQELSREKLLSKLAMSIQAFTYSACCELNEARRLVKMALSSTNKSAGMTSDENNLDLIFSKFGIVGVECDGALLVMPRPTSSTDDGTQPFNGRLGKLRYLGLAVVAAAGAVAADLVQLVLPFPLEGSGTLSTSPTGHNRAHRSPIVYPILYGHVLTHVVAAICASCGRARARTDALEIAWPVPFSSGGSFVSSERMQTVDSVVEDSEGFLKLGLLARILQVLLGKLDLQSVGSIPGVQMEEFVCCTLKRICRSTDASTLEGTWRHVCMTLIEMALCPSSDKSDITEGTSLQRTLAERFDEGSELAADAACSYLGEIGSILQVLIPGVMTRYSSGDVATTLDSTRPTSSLVTLEKLRSLFRLEPILDMLHADSVHAIISGWYNDARRHADAASLPGDTIVASGAAVCSRLYRTQGFRIFDWPMESCDAHRAKSKAILDTQSEVAEPMDIDTIQPAGVSLSSSDNKNQHIPPLVTFSIKKSVPLIGGYQFELSAESSSRPRVARIPTSYTDLYAELGRLLPESEQIAVCLICGEVLNAGGKGECTRHSFKCGAGTGMFFLLQECSGLIMHNGKAAYIHSPYVDSHGETPQYRGRPLNLDLDRYDHLREVWSGHAIRQQVIAERDGSRQVIVPDFY